MYCRVKDIEECDPEDEPSGKSTSKKDQQNKNKSSKEEKLKRVQPNLHVSSISAESLSDSFAEVGSKEHHDKLLIRPGGRWYDQVIQGMASATCTLFLPCQHFLLIISANTVCKCGQTFIGIYLPHRFTA